MIEYVQDGGGHCPKCGSLNLAGGSMYIETGSAFQEIICNDCGEDWTDRYILSGIVEGNGDNYVPFTLGTGSRSRACLP